MKWHYVFVYSIMLAGIIWSVRELKKNWKEIEDNEK